MGEGELLVRGPNVFAGYWRDADATAAAFADGWLLTGDVAERDAEGYYRIVGRLKDMVICGGENVYPAEIENVLHEHPAVAEAAVVGVPDERWGEACLAFVVLADGESAEEDELLAFCRERLASYKVPREVRFVDGLPRNAMNKVAKSRARLELVTDVTKVLTARSASGHARKLLEAAEQVFAELGYHDASIVKITEAAGVGQGTFYLYFASKKADLRRARARPERARPPRDERGVGEREDAGRARAARLRGVLPLHGRAPGALPDHPAGRVRLAGDAPLHYERLTEGYVDGAARRRWTPARSPQIDPEVLAWSADGDRRARRHALDPLGRTRRVPERVIDELGADHRAAPSAPGTSIREARTCGHGLVPAGAVDDRSRDRALPAASRSR